VARPARRAKPVRRRGRERDREQHLGGDDGGAGMHVTSSPIDWYAARAAGIVAYVLLTTVVALGISMAGRAPGRRWRRWPMFAVGIGATLHGLGSGTDRSTPWMIALFAGCAAAVAAAVTWRVGVRRGLGVVVRPSAVIGAGAVAAALVAALALGPLQAHPRQWN